MSKTKKTFTVYKGTYSRPEPVEVEVLCENGTLVAHPAISTETSKQPIVITHKPTGCAIGSTHKVGNAARSSRKRYRLGANQNVQPRIVRHRKAVNCSSSKRP